MIGYQIRIPMIQRDYAQGRDNEEGIEVRKTFIPYLMRAFLFPIHLDFIYGEKKDGIFIPLDGQQRLTTLLLLYWLAGEIPDQKWVFDFETRRIAQHFVKNLLKTRPPERSDIFENQSSTYISYFLKKQPWFFESWLKDATVSGMLTMLDSLANQFPEAFITNSLCDISFSCEFIGKIVSDKVYLKMNARGKPLTKWENLKALLDGKIGDTEKEWKDKIDATWENQFWQILTDEDRNKPSKAVATTHFWLSSIVHFSICEYLAKNTSSNNGGSLKDKRLADIGLFHNHNATLSLFDEYLPKGDPKPIKTIIKYASIYFNALSPEKLKNLQYCWSKNRAENRLWAWTTKGEFLKVEKNSAWTYNDHVRLYILTRDTKKLTEVDRKKRALLNLLDFSTVAASNFANCILSVDAILESARPDFIKAAGFNELQREEESIKWGLDAEDMCNLESNYALFNGSIGFLGPENDITTELLHKRIKMFKATYINEKTSKFKGEIEQFISILQYFEKELPRMLRVPNKNHSDWINLLRNKQIRAALINFFNNKTPASISWVTFYKKVHDKNRGVCLETRAGITYLLNSTRFFPNSIRLTYTPIELANLNKTEKKFCARDDSFLKLKDKPEGYYAVKELRAEDPSLYIKNSDYTFSLIASSER
ncbi:MAG: DUF262 domain-containing protein [Kiritimatiellae bacterium]|nr:DUF262 domain-containing protein [Kiritimatiellia bacterium]